jgi:hypothetical protein
MLKRESIVTALLEGVSEGRKGIFRKLFDHIVDTDKGNYVQTLPMARRAIDMVNDLTFDNVEAFGDELVAFVERHVKYSTVYDDIYLGKTPDPEADYLSGLTNMFVARWNFTHPIVEA